MWSCHPANPALHARPSIASCSLTLTGRPCSGPMGLPFCARYSSRYRARVRAASGRTSVTQLVYYHVSVINIDLCLEALDCTSCWATPALLRNAVVTSIQLNFPVASRCTNSSAGFFTISFSAAGSSSSGMLDTLRGRSCGISGIGGCIFAIVLSRY